MSNDGKGESASGQTQPKGRDRDDRHHGTCGGNPSSASEDRRGAVPTSDRTPPSAPSGYTKRMTYNTRAHALPPERVQRVLDLLVQGLTRNEIAGRLGISPHTVKTMLRCAYRRLDCANNVQAALIWSELRAPPGGWDGERDDIHRAKEL